MDTIARILEDARMMAREAGKLHLGYFRSRRLKVESKYRDSDVVTASDREAEELIMRHIAERWPGHSVVAEESGRHGGDDGWQWVVDPLDGTTNFSNGLPLFAVSIGVRHNGRTVVGVVYLPVLDEMFEATLGGGARLNGAAVRASSKDRLSAAVVSTGFPVDREVNPDDNLDNVRRVLPAVRGLRRLGSAAIDLCYVAAGFLDGYWELALHEWDVCAGLLIASEAGAVCRRFREDRGWCVLASAPVLDAQLSQLIR